MKSAFVLPETGNKNLLLIFRIPDELLIRNRFQPTPARMGRNHA